MKKISLIILLFFIFTNNSWSLEIIDKLFNKTKVYKCYYKDLSGPTFIGINNDFIIINFDEEEKYAIKYPITNENEKTIYAELLVNQKLDRRITFKKISKELTLDYRPGRTVKTISDYFELSCELIEN
ncbi:hypothetical protein [Candidatus Pelagibacter sp.]|uniref:hypothetical protein n=1 Tax=Candidatus Pelagibacter sp. TaxID=2024849 RepID=UPI003D12B1F0